MGIGWGSTKGAILDAIDGLDVKFVQVLYMEPFPTEIAKELKGNLILVENNSQAQFGKLLRQETGINIKNKILKFDGRPILAEDIIKNI